MGPPKRAFAFSGCVPDQLSLSSLIPKTFQTLLEQMKGIFKKVQGIPPSKIPPTVGLNGTSYHLSSSGCTASVLDDTLSGVGGSSSVEILTVPSKLW